MTRFATPTLGEAPRTDLAPAFEAVAPQETEVLHAGLLNGIDPEEAARRFALAGDEARFTTKFRSGAVVTVGRRAKFQGLRTRIRELEAEGADLILLLCNDAFDELDEFYEEAGALQAAGKAARRAHLLQPGRLLPAVFAAHLNPKCVGVVVPRPELALSPQEKWRVHTKTTLLAAAPPYSTTKKELADAARQLVEAGAEAVVLDCMGYDEAQRQICAEAAGVPVLASRSVTADLVHMLL